MKMENEKKKNTTNNETSEQPKGKKYDIDIDYTHRYVPNGYGVKMVITNKKNIPDSMLNELKQHPAHHEFPFYVLKRLYMKTISNMVRDIADIAVYRGNYSLFETDGVEKISSDTSRESVLLYIFGGDRKLLRDFKIFEAASDRRRHGIRFKYPNKKENKFTLTSEGELVTWDVKRSIKHNMLRDDEYCIIEKGKLEAIVNWLDRLIELSPPNIHQFAAISYLEGVVAGKYFYEKPVFGYSVK